MFACLDIIYIKLFSLKQSNQKAKAVEILKLSERVTQLSINSTINI